MATTHLMFGRKAVTAEDVKPGKVEPRQVSAEVRQIIRDAKLTSLEPLLKAGSSDLIRQLVHQYWDEM